MAASFRLCYLIVFLASRSTNERPFLNFFFSHCFFFVVGVVVVVPSCYPLYFEFFNARAKENVDAI